MIQLYKKKAPLFGAFLITILNFYTPYNLTAFIN